MRYSKKAAQMLSRLQPRDCSFITSDMFKKHKSMGLRLDDVKHVYMDDEHINGTV